MDKLKPWTKVKVLWCSNSHKYKIWSIITIKKCYSKSLAYWYMYDIIWGLYTIWSNDIEVVEDTFKVGDVIKFKTGNTRYVIVEVLDTEYKYKHLWNWKIFWCSKDSDIEVLDKTSEDYEYIFINCKYILDTIEWKERYNNFTKKNIPTTFNFWDKVKVIDAWRICSTYDEAAEAMWLTKWVRINWILTSEQKESITNNNYYKVIWFHFNQSKNEYVWIENILDWKQYIINSEWLEHINLSWSVLAWTSNLQDQLYTNTATAFAYALESTLAWTATWCVLNTSQVSEYITCAWTIKRNTLPTNNNTMEKLNQLRADKFFALEKNLTAIESLDTLLKDAIELIEATYTELARVQSKLVWLNKKLESATNNQDVAMLKDLIASTKVVQEFVDELKGKTISKFETAKTKFDVAWYLKD